MSAVRLDVHAREPFADGHRFDGAGAYEVITATAHYTVDPAAPAHRPVTDLELAGNPVRFSGDVEILRPRGRRGSPGPARRRGRRSRRW
ncbi:hypothetical protein OG562_00180 [Streptomyces sp. NBC_01275]|uniref:hypothetical protein n=1 Tax=Streptomyces sp. NBC_01275 TaxID=2903807 RepID=UPI00225934F1|nr:hypothetical protein [Streptomyces sp. NBC_01275]MCX4759435.1 hypothetical protein [Streptomyces sp. NBC_01275]